MKQFGTHQTLYFWSLSGGQRSNALMSMASRDPYLTIYLYHNINCNNFQSSKLLMFERVKTPLTLLYLTLSTDWLSF